MSDECEKNTLSFCCLRTFLRKLQSYQIRMSCAMLKGYLYARKHFFLNGSNMMIVDTASHTKIWSSIWQHKVIFNTYVAHGLTCSLTKTYHFSNHLNSHESSLGFLMAETPYHGKHGLSLSLKGLASMEWQ